LSIKILSKGSGFWVQGSGFRDQRFRVQRFKVQRFRVQRFRGSKVLVLRALEFEIDGLAIVSILDIMSCVIILCG